MERFVEYNIDISKFGLAISEDYKIIEEYPNDPRGQSCLILLHIEETPIHAVIAPVEKELIIITVYIPSRDKWNEDFTRRRSE